MKHYVCPACKGTVIRRVEKNKCPNCLTEIEYVGTKNRRVAVLSSEKKTAKAIVEYLAERIADHRNIMILVSRSDYMREIGIYYVLTQKARAMIESNNLNLDTSYFIYRMIDHVFSDPDLSYTANGIVSLSFIAGRLFNRIAVRIVEEERNRQNEKSINERKYADIDLLERNPAHELY